jgi:predicted nucleic acid-binding protein
VDTSALFALVIREDKHHAVATQFVRQLVSERLPVAVALPTLYEAHRLILQKRDPTDARAFLENYGGGALEVIEAGKVEYAAALEILDHYLYVKLSLTDAVSVAIMLARGIGSIFSFDDDFLRVGVRRVPPL